MCQGGCSNGLFDFEGTENCKYLSKYTVGKMTTFWLIKNPHIFWRKNSSFQAQKLNFCPFLGAKILKCVENLAQKFENSPKRRQNIKKASFWIL